MYIVYVLSFVWFGEEMTALRDYILVDYNPVYVQVTHEYYRLVVQLNFHSFWYSSFSSELLFTLWSGDCLLKNHWI